MLVITGSAGFIGSAVARYMNANGRTDLLLVDDFSRPEKARNLAGVKFNECIGRESLPVALAPYAGKIEAVVHLGARTNTTEFDYTLLKVLNVDYSKMIWAFCTQHSIPLIYASSAATYGAGEHGYSDDHALIPVLKPLNPYGESKQEFDRWVLEQKDTPPKWFGLKFFNVYGFGEFHKGRMASVIFHAFQQVRKEGRMKLFRSHRPECKDGEQKRDFIYVEDICRVIDYILHHSIDSGIYNLGTGKAETFLSLAEAVFAAMGKSPAIDYVDIPADIRDKYQYYTQADMSKWNLPFEFTSLAEGVNRYIAQLERNTSFD